MVSEPGRCRAKALARRALSDDVHAWCRKSGIKTDIEMVTAAAGGATKTRRGGDSTGLWGRMASSCSSMRMNARGCCRRCSPKLRSLAGCCWKAVAVPGRAVPGRSWIGWRLGADRQRRAGDAGRWGRCGDRPGMELGGDVAYGHPDLGIEFKASGRVLPSHEDGLEDAGVSLALGPPRRACPHLNIADRHRRSEPRPPAAHRRARPRGAALRPLGATMGRRR